MKKLVIGILAHVDAGKTTLSEALLYAGGSIRKLGRVDNQDAFLDTDALERQRGITIFSKQAVLTLPETKITLLDTPGHVDFSAEMERTLQILDYAILVISGADGVQGHTRTLWRLLAQYRIPVFLFVNKMDQNGTDQKALLAELKELFDDGCINFMEADSESFYENTAMCEERLLEAFLETGIVEQEEIKRLIYERKLFPCFFGSALKYLGVEQFLADIGTYTKEPEYTKVFGARVFKISRDEQGNRLTHLKITGGSLKVKTLLGEEKINQIRIYSGEKYESVQEADAGEVCAVTGFAATYPGQGFGSEDKKAAPLLEPVLTYGIRFPEGCDPAENLNKLRQLEEEDPLLHITWDQRLREIQAKVMGQIQIEVLKSLIQSRFGLDVEFDAGSIVYKETIAGRCEGVGHFEPLRHYAEVHLILEPLEQGSGLVFASSCSEDILDKNWQHLILTHLREKEHLGVLTGSPVTDMKITLAAGRAHIKHTEGGDFRQATYRAVRQGLKQAGSILLEPYYEFRLELPEDMIGRAMTDVEKMSGTIELPEHKEKIAVICGTAPVAAMREYAKEVAAYTRGNGRLFCSLKGYAPCHNQEEVKNAFAYDSESDMENPTGSVFCSHGAGFAVPWNQVKDYMHLESVLTRDKIKAQEGQQEYLNGQAYLNQQAQFNEQVCPNVQACLYESEEWIAPQEVDAILDRVSGANRKENRRDQKCWGASRITPSIPPETSRKRVYHPAEQKKSYLLVDGYNIIFAWEELKELAAVHIDGARGRLLDILSDYRGVVSCTLIVVFDAYRVQGHATEIIKYHNIHVVYTKEAETADQYIEKFAHENGRKYDVTVATSDGLEQIIIWGQGCRLLSAREFQDEVIRVQEITRSTYAAIRQAPHPRLFDDVPKKELEGFASAGEDDQEK